MFFFLHIYTRLKDVLEGTGFQAIVEFSVFSQHTVYVHGKKKTSVDEGKGEEKIRN